MENVQMEASETSCPTCKEHQRDTKLQLKQINFDSAVYLCPRKKCTYPKGHPWLLVQRTFEDLTKLISEKKLVKEEKKLKRKKETHKESQNTNNLQNILNISTDSTSLSSIKVESADVKDELVEPATNWSEITQKVELDTVKDENTEVPEDVPKSEDMFDNLMQELGLLGGIKSEDVVQTENVNGLSESLVDASLDCDNLFSTSVSNVLDEFMSSGVMENAEDFSALSLDDILGM